MLFFIGLAVFTWFAAAGLFIEIYTDVKYPTQLNIYVDTKKNYMYNEAKSNIMLQVYKANSRIIH